MTHLWSIAFQAINFLLLFVLLRRYLWKPVRDTIEQRRKEIDDAEAGLLARTKAAEETRLARDAKTAAEDKERARVLVAAAVALARDRETVLSAARTDAETARKLARTELDNERVTAAAELTDATLDVSISVAARLLSQVCGTFVTGAFVDRICEWLDTLPKDEIASLREEAAASPTVELATTPALADEAKAAVRGRLAPHLGDTVKLDFIVDDALIAGAELRLLHTRLGYSFRECLVGIRKELGASRSAVAGPRGLLPAQKVVAA